MKLPPVLRSARMRYTLLYSGVLFVLSALLLGAVYLGLSMKLDDAAETETLLTAEAYQQLTG